MTFLAVVGLAASAAHADLVTNGGFETNGGNGQIGFNTFATGWSVPAPPGSYTFLFAPGTADTTGAIGQYGFLGLWGPGNGSANGLPATSPDGGYYIAADGAFQDGAISQTINGLTAGQTYTVGFYWAAAQQYGFNGPTSSGWTVDLGSNPAQTTPVVGIPSQGFSGWTFQTFNFTADSSSDVLSFLAVGNGGAALPPFSLLDGVSVNSTVPEPSCLLIWGVGAMCIGFIRLRRRAKAAAV
ncbi:MAG: hypothetical protein ACLP9L_33140 [Thermoguttaceae bacterium]